MYWEPQACATFLSGRPPCFAQHDLGATGSTLSLLSSEILLTSGIKQADFMLKFGENAKIPAESELVTFEHYPARNLNPVALLLMTRQLSLQQDDATYAIKGLARHEAHELQKSATYGWLEGKEGYTEPFLYFLLTTSTAIFWPSPSNSYEL